MSQLKKGVFLSYVQIILTNVIGIVLTPFIIRSLGNSEYGLYTLIGSFVGYLSVMDLGLNSSIVRYIAKYRAEEDEEGISNFLTTTMIIYVVISLIIVSLGVLMLFNLDLIFGNSLTPAEIEKARIMTIILIFNLAITLPGSAFEAICNAYEHFVYPRSMRIIRYLIRSALVVFILSIGFKSIGLVVLDTILNISIIISNGWYVYKRLNLKIKIKKSLFKRELVKEIFSYSIWIFVMALVTQLQWQGGQVILGIKRDTTVVAIYAVGVMLGGYYGAFASAINSVFLPRAMKMTVRQASGQVLTDEMIKIGRVVILVLLLILSGFIVLGKEFVLLWVGKDYSEAWTIALIIMIVSTNILTQSFADSLLRAKKLFKFKGLTYISSILIGLVIGFFLIEYYNATGMILGIAISWFISQMIMNIYFSRKLRLEISRFYKEITKNTVLVFAIITIVGLLINKSHPTSSWLVLGFKIISFTVVYSLGMFYIGANKFEKGLVTNLITRFKRK